MILVLEKPLLKARLLIFLKTRNWHALVDNVIRLEVPQALEKQVRELVKTSTQG